MRGTRIVGATLAVLVAVGLTACTAPDAPSRSAPASSAAPTQPPSASPTETAAPIIVTPEPSTSSADDPDRPKNQCADADLGVSVVYLDAGAGSIGYRVLFTNAGGETCALRGTPGVSVVGKGDGTQLGRPADRNQDGTRTLLLQAGDTVSSILQVTNIGTDGGPLSGCTVVQGDGYRVYPPHSRHAFFVEDSKARACSPGPSFMRVGPVRR